MRGSASRRLFVVACAIAVFAGCSPKFNWREVRSPDGFVVALPARAQTVTRDVKLPDAVVPMSMTSTGVGATLFAVGVAKVPLADAATQDRRQVLSSFRDALVRNVNGTVTRTAPALLSLAPGDSRTVVASEAIEASGRDPQGRAVRVFARFFVVDDRVYQVVALGGEGELTSEARDTFFTSFRLVQ